MSQASAPGDFVGVLLIDKPSGITSHDVVDRVRRKLRMKRVGHAGTLDPAATGLMIVLVGKATKLSQYLMGLDKVYEGVGLLGQSTDTQDADGEVIAEREVPALTTEDLTALIKTFEGDQYQTPPMYSAKKINGVPLYKLARKGKEVEREARVVRVKSFVLDAFTSPEIEFTVACSKGTYIRTLVHDLGEKIGCGAHLKNLRRTEIGDFEIEDSLELAEFEELDGAEIKRWLIPPYQAAPSNVVNP